MKLLFGIFCLIVQANLSAIVLSLQGVFLSNPVLLLTVVLLISLLVNALLIQQFSTGKKNVESWIRDVREQQRKQESQKHPSNRNFTDRDIPRSAGNLSREEIREMIREELKENQDTNAQTTLNQYPILQRISRIESSLEDLEKASLKTIQSRIGNLESKKEI